MTADPLGLDLLDNHGWAFPWSEAIDWAVWRARRTGRRHWVFGHRVNGKWLYAIYSSPAWRLR
jgi:hypothetical protein